MKKESKSRLDRSYENYVKRYEAKQAMMRRHGYEMASKMIKNKAMYKVVIEDMKREGRKINLNQTLVAEQAYEYSLKEARRFKDNGWYHPDQNSAQDGEMNKKYYGNQVVVLYENLSYSNLWDLKDQLRQTNVDTPGFNIDDAMAIMKIKGTDGKYALEGTDNWFSMTFFDDRISDKKMNLILDLMNYLLDEEGTRFSVFGFENFDYKMVDGKPEIIEEAWPKDKNGEYAEKTNGARYLRYLVSLGYDTYEYDPLTDKTIVEYLNDWEDEMKTQKEAGNLKVLKETSEVMWLTTPKKSKSAGIMRSTALLDAMKFIYRTDGYATINDFKAKFDNATWRDVLAEINKALGH